MDHIFLPQATYAALDAPFAADPLRHRKTLLKSLLTPQQVVASVLGLLDLSIYDIEEVEDLAIHAATELVQGKLDSVEGVGKEVESAKNQFALYGIRKVLGRIIKFLAMNVTKRGIEQLIMLALKDPKVYGRWMVDPVALSSDVWEVQSKALVLRNPTPAFGDKFWARLEAGSYMASATWRPALVEASAAFTVDTTALVLHTVSRMQSALNAAKGDANRETAIINDTTDTVGTGMALISRQTVQHIGAVVYATFWGTVVYPGWGVWVGTLPSYIALWL